MKKILKWVFKDDPMTDWVTVLACIYFMFGSLLSMTGSAIILYRELSKRIIE